MTTMAPSLPVLEVRNLTVSVALENGRRANAVEDVSFRVESGGTLGIVGESGSGKTMTSLAIMGLLPPGARVDSGSILLQGESLLEMSPRAMRRIRGKRIAMVLQDPMTALDPSFTIRSQLAEPLEQHRSLRGGALDAGLIASLERVQLSGARERLRQYAHQLSGGMRQRVVSAIALAGDPTLLIADEPTTALDATTQARYLRLLVELQAETGFALVLIAHDLGVVREVCERVAVMYAGRVMEEGPVECVFESTQQPYTRALLGAIPNLGEDMILTSIEGQAPDLSDEIPGCRFAPRCEFVRDKCVDREPPLSPRESGHAARCWGTELGGWIQP